MSERTSVGQRPHTAQTTTSYPPDLWTPPRSPSSARRYQGTGNQQTIIRVTDHRGQGQQRIQRASLQQPQTANPHTTVPRLPQQAQSRQRKKHPLRGKHPLFYVGSVLMLFLIGWWLINALIGWAHTTWDDMHYGRPRTFQTDLDVGHGGTSHFTVENLDGHIVVYELPIY